MTSIAPLSRGYNARMAWREMARNISSQSRIERNWFVPKITTIVLDRFTVICEFLVIVLCINDEGKSKVVN